MASEIENKKKSRKVMRTSFTKAANELEALLKGEPCGKDCLDVAFNILKGKNDILTLLNGEIYELLLENTSESDLEMEMETCDSYTKKFVTLRVQYDKTTEDKTSVDSQRSGMGARVNSLVSQSSGNPGMRKFKLPRIELKQYGGDIKDWLTFWAQFRKVHEDISIDNCDKIEYLYQATIPGSRARQLVDSYPAMSENYPKIIESMQSRFGREDLQIEVYVRELLKLILSNSTSQQIDIGSLYDRLETQMRALETLGITTDRCAAILFPLIESCLPNELLRVWQRSAFGCSTAKLEDRLKNLMVFLRQEVENEQRINLASEGFGFGSVTTKLSSLDVGTASVNKVKPSLHRSVECPTAAGLVNSEASRCIFCEGQHRSETCFKTQAMSMSQKKEILFKKRACYRCLKIGHHTNHCRGRMQCLVCGRAHVTLMCSELSSNKVGQKVQEDGGKTRGLPKEQVLTNQTLTHVFLQTLRVTLVGMNQSKVVRALIDTGSQRTYILRSTAQQLGLPPKREEKIIHCLFGGTEVPKSHHCYDVTICSGGFSYTFEALDQPIICGDVAPVFEGPWTSELRVLDIAISDVEDSDPIELLLGADISGRLFTGRRRELLCGLYAMETLVGWTLMGKIPKKGSTSDAVLSTLNLLTMDSQISNFWNLETIGIKEPTDKATKEEIELAAKEFFLENITVNEEKRYEVCLPWLEGHPPLSTNYALARKRLGSAVRKLKAEGLFELYDLVFHEWLGEGIIEQVNDFDDVQIRKGHFLPHRPVLKPESTTKIRPVFDASAHEKDRPSLNHCLDKGPNLIELIPSILLRFREHKFGVTADIRKAFLQISLNEKDRDFLRFLWVDSDGNEVVFRHKRVVFGLNSSPFLLAATLEYHLSQCLEETRKSDSAYSKETVEKLRYSFYVDNCVTSLPKENSVSRFIRESVAVMAIGHFDLRGWECTQESDTTTNTEEPCPVLGLSWFPKKDVLTINKSFLTSLLHVDTNGITKRTILSLTQKVFDPLGFLCPALLVPKIMLQRLWKDNLTWDQPVDEVTARLFAAWATDLYHLTEIKVPRWILVGDESAEEVSLHTFCDASQDAYACAVFVRVKLNGKISVILLGAKARVAPIRKSETKMTIPRLELLAATIGARLFAHIVKNFTKSFPCFFWSDSSTIISWIRRKEEWSVFVWNRVAEIRRLTSIENWRHLPGVQNPADLPSRGCSPKQLFQSKWWEGPGWLYGTQETWPQGDNTTCDENEVEAERKRSLVTTLVNVGDTNAWNLQYFSKFTKAVRMMAYVLRFIHNCKRVEERRIWELSFEEYDEAEKLVFKAIQNEVFCGVTDPRIGSLSPFCDENGLIRLKSRVCNREDTESYRFPIVLPSKHCIVSRLIMDTHIRSCHVGTQGLLSILRERFWILGGRRTVRAVISKCVICKRYSGKPLDVESPPLPLDRVRDAVAFEVTGIDFAGPFFLKYGNKAWICLFTCAIFRAVHVELCTSLSTTCFLQAFRRFVSRRGRPKTVYSDNGRNFVGADNAFASLNWDVIVSESSVQRIQWRFNPPTASWWGGFWERLIGVVKKLLRKVLGRASLDYEALLTVLCECEAVVNARPLTYLAEDPRDLVALCPSMFLRDQAENGVPDCDAVDRLSLCKKVRRIQSIREHLRSRFRTEYLGQLKLLCDKKTERQVAVGDLVIIGSDENKRLEWPIARIVDVLPGKDGNVRLARVETSRGQMLRPIQRLYPLECCSVPDPQFRKDARQRDHGQGSDDQQEGDDKLAETTEPSEDINSAGVPSRVSKGNIVKTTRSGRVSKRPSRFDDL